jgi:hypothetical protein
MNLNTISLPCLVGKANKSMTQIYPRKFELSAKSQVTLWNRSWKNLLPLTSWNGSSHPTRLTTLKRGMSLLGPFSCIILPHLVSYLQIPRDRCFFQKIWPLYNRTLEIFSLWNFCLLNEESFQPPDSVGRTATNLLVVHRTIHSTGDLPPSTS